MKVNKYAKIVVLAMLLIAAVQGFSQIGGNLAPLQYSIHTYSIEMDDEAYEAVWGIYPPGTTQAQLEAGTAVPLTPGVAYILVPPTPTWKSGGRAYFRVQFNGNMVPYNASVPGSGEYVIGYMETTIDGNACATAVVQDFILYGPFDVDIDLQAADPVEQCSDEDGVWHQPGDNVYQTTVQYEVTIEYPGTVLGGYIHDMTWNFDYQVVVDGEGAGANGTIASITISGGTVPVTPPIPPSSSNFTANCTVDPSQTTPLTFTIVYNEVLGVRQDIRLRIYDIYGSYAEQDIDEVNGTQTGNNIVNNSIYALPDVGHIEAWN